MYEQKVRDIFDDQSLEVEEWESEGGSRQLKIHGLDIMICFDELEKLSDLFKTKEIFFWADWNSHMNVEGHILIEKFSLPQE